MTSASWARPAQLSALAQRLAPAGEDPGTAWSDLVARATAADALMRVHDEVGELTPALPRDAIGVWGSLHATAQEGAETMAGLVAHFEHLSEDQLTELAETARATAEETSPVEPAPDESAPDSVAESVPASDEQQFVRRIGSEIARRSGVTDIAGDLGVDGLIQARSIAGSIVPDGLGQFLPEAAVVSLAASAGMRLRSGESVPEVKAWLVAELSTIGVANAASVAVQLLSGLVLLRPLAVLGARWGRARADTSAQATIAIRASRQRLAPLLRPQLQPLVLPQPSQT